MLFSYLCFGRYSMLVTIFTFFFISFTSALGVMMYQYAAKISYRHYTSADVFFWDSDFPFYLFSFSFPLSVSPSFYSPSFYRFFLLPTFMQSPTFWWSIWVNEDKISIESVACARFYPLFHLFFFLQFVGFFLSLYIYIYIYIYMYVYIYISCLYWIEYKLYTHTQKKNIHTNTYTQKERKK